MLSQSQEERLAYIDFRICFLGTISRNDLMERFGMQAAAATRDLAMYRQRAPDNIRYDTTAKTYQRSDLFSPLYDASSDRILAALASGFGIDPVGALLPCERTASRLESRPSPTLSVLTRAIHQGRAVNAEYCSLDNGRTVREIVPFALADNGVRWHVRGYDRNRSAFENFIVTRITRAEIIDTPVEEHETRESDIQWNRILELELVPHPSVQHHEAVEVDYAMQDGVLNVNIRAAVAGYILRLWNVDCSEDHSLPEPGRHLWLRNWQALYGVENLAMVPGCSGKYACQ
ncbi:MAG: WYL domain-containing protein [Gammaproteobacteria bacterium]|nr:WYL domain-containing protein [Gammaproteobacteria bacterium]